MLFWGDYNGYSVSSGGQTGFSKDDFVPSLHCQLGLYFLKENYILIVLNEDADLAMFQLSLNFEKYALPCLEEKVLPKCVSFWNLNIQNGMKVI